MTIWIGTPPHACDVCGAPIVNEFYDMATKQGPWANMCPTCAMQGVGIGQVGTGRGQHYKQQDDGKFHKVEG